MSLLVETLFDIDNLPSIKAYPKSPTGIPTHVFHEEWSECIELASDRCDPSSSLVIDPPPINDTLIQTSVPTRDIKIKLHDWFVDRCEVN